MSLYYKCQKINLNGGGSYIDCQLIGQKVKKTTLHPINSKDNKYFQHIVTVVLNYGEIKKDL